MYAPLLPTPDGSVAALSSIPLQEPRTRFQEYVMDREIRPDAADDLFGVLTTSKVVLVLDDSGSMNTRIIEPGMPAFVPAGTASVTRWSELEKLAACVVEMITAATPSGAHHSWAARTLTITYRRRNQLWEGKLVRTHRHFPTERKQIVKSFPLESMMSWM